MTASGSNTDPGQRQWKWDVFISYSSSDVGVAREMKRKLVEEENLKVFTYEEDVPPGSNIVDAISNAIHWSRKCVLIVSSDFLQSDYFSSEYGWAIVEQNERGFVCCIPVLYNIEIADIPVEFRNVIDANCLKYNEGGQEHFYRRLVDAIKQDVSIRTQITVTHTGVGLAWSYFYGYLNIILPGLEQRVNEKRDAFDCRVFPKFIIILPVSCSCPEKPPDEAFTYKGFIEYNYSRAGNKDRCYKSTVYDFAFKNREGKQVHCYLMMEFATPLLSLFQMCEGKVAQLTKPMMTNERHTFKNVIEEILVSGKMARKYLLVDFRDEDEQTSSNKWRKETVGEAVARAVENDMIKDGCTGEYLYPV